jgi:hypothetical protein
MIKSLITFANMLLDTAWALIFILLSSLVFYLIGIGHKLKINKPKKNHHTLSFGGLPIALAI